MKGKAIRKGVFIPAFSCVLIAGAVGLINNQLLISFFKGAFELAYQNLSWLYQWIVLTIVILCVILTFSKVGNIRIGGPDAKPKYGFWSWFAMSLTGGIGASIVSSSISQPITFLQSIWENLMVMALNLAHLKPYCLHWGDLSTNGQSFLMRSMEYAAFLLRICALTKNSLFRSLHYLCHCLETRLRNVEFLL